MSDEFLDRGGTHDICRPENCDRASRSWASSDLMMAREGVIGNLDTGLVHDQSVALVTDLESAVRADYATELERLAAWIVTLYLHKNVATFSGSRDVLDTALRTAGHLFDGHTLWNHGLLRDQDHVPYCSGRHRKRRLARAPQVWSGWRWTRG